MHHYSFRGLRRIVGTAVLLGAGGVTLVACAVSTAEQEPSAAGDHGGALGEAVQATIGASCRSDCNCQVDEVCSIPTGATSGTCIVNPELGFAPEPPAPLCTANCQCQEPGQTNGPYCVHSTNGYGFCKASVPAYVPVSGSWYNPARSGWGLAISNDLYGKSADQYGDISVVWYTYTTSGVPVWYSGGLSPNGNVYSGPMYLSRWASTSRSTYGTQIGTMTIDPTSKTTGTFRWTFDAGYGISGSQPVQNLAFGGSGSGPQLTGQWFADTPYPAAPLGEIPILLNLFLDVHGNTVVADVGLYDATTGQPTWVTGSGTESSAGFTLTLLRVTGINLYPGSTGTPSTSYQQEGSITVQNINAAASAANFSLAMPASFQPPVSGLQSLWRQTN
jgi:hypothetical protein